MPWASNTSISLICSKKWFETPDAVSFELEAINDDNSFDFKPGQFTSLGFSIDAEKHYRAYSISSTPNQSKLQFTVKRVPGGLVSNHIVEDLSVGDALEVMEPMGAFNSVECLPKSKVLMISAGCGVTPIMSMVGDWLESRKDIDIEFLHFAKEKQQVIYFDKLEGLDEQHANFNLKLVLENNVGTDYPQGLFDIDKLNAACPDFLERTVYLCGPVGFMEVVRISLDECGFDMDQFHQESFTPTSANDDKLDSNMGLATVSVADFGVELQVDKGSLLLDALEQGGVPVIAACRSGICGSCKCRVKVGQVESTSYETLSEQDRAEGFVLACSSKVTGDVEVGLN
ncbi:hybrid-cluster NAD(P)-dependent oxidoreductase [Vibrio sp. ZSDZ34]|uniref:Hybrid-cluster NAD(P)-dependent oxidoreductase n=1 Tax=Vibrio gelatinilyticus TaxID=2893468 RepID=A0A9X1WBT4_9VIBR|nr:hybrid-cluster NAD(P)-dependent oxidoreductase [Vibrio gelatinilyticus]MCJ2376253.1 hybrid-cluster NAD(P)-dependent oxidoreductase [Vibrio gelatinilyticus]